VIIYIIAEVVGYIFVSKKVKKRLAGFADHKKLLID